MNKTPITPWLWSKRIGFDQARLEKNAFSFWSLTPAKIANRASHLSKRHISSGKCFMVKRMGLGAAWPKPQIEASTIVALISSSRL